MEDIEFYNDLDKTYTYIESLLNHYSKKSDSYLHTPSLVSTRLDGRPTARIIVLRNFNAKKRCLEFYTDKRSNKVREIEQSSFGQLHFYSHEHKLQLRLDCELKLNSDETALKNTWKNMPEQSKTIYLQTTDCGEKENSSDNEKVDLNKIDEGFKYFLIVSAYIQSIECLYLRFPQHRRSKFVWQGDTLESSWLTP